MRRDVLLALLALLGPDLGPEWLPPRPRHFRVTTTRTYDSVGVYIDGAELRAIAPHEANVGHEFVFIDEMGDIPKTAFAFTRHEAACKAP